MESLPAYHEEPVLYGNASHPVTGWRELIRTSESVLATFEGTHRTGSPAVIGNERARFSWRAAAGRVPDATGRRCAWLGRRCGSGDLGDLRLARRGRLHFALSSTAFAVATVPASASAAFLVGGRELAPVDVAIWTEDGR